MDSFNCTFSFDCSNRQYRSPDQRVKKQQTIKEFVGAISNKGLLFSGTVVAQKGSGLIRGSLDGRHHRWWGNFDKTASVMRGEARFAAKMLQGRFIE